MNWIKFIWNQSITRSTLNEGIEFVCCTLFNHIWWPLSTRWNHENRFVRIVYKAIQFAAHTFGKMYCIWAVAISSNCSIPIRLHLMVDMYKGVSNCHTKIALFLQLDSSDNLNLFDLNCNWIFHIACVTHPYYDWMIGFIRMIVWIMGLEIAYYQEFWRVIIIHAHNAHLKNVEIIYGPKWFTIAQLLFARILFENIFKINQPFTTAFWERRYIHAISKAVNAITWEKRAITIRYL